MSSSRDIKAGVPQGTVLGPLFLLIYINDIVENLLNIVRLFADDTSLACSSASMRDIEGILSHDLLALSTCRSNGWSISIPVKRDDAYHFPNLVFEDVLINFVESHKHLRLIFF